MAMKKRKRKGTPAGEVRVFVKRVELNIARTAFNSPAGACMSDIEIHGELRPPIRATTSILLHVSADMHFNLNDEQHRTRPIGSFSQRKPHFKAHVSLPRDQFEQLWIVAAAGRLRYVYLDDQRPDRVNSLITIADFGTEFIDEPS